MITLIEALNYRCLRYVSRPLDPFHVLVGPNASGKTTFLDVIGFLRDLVSEGLDGAVSTRTRNPQDLLFLRQGEKFELALEASIPEELRQRTARPELDTARYEVAVGFDETQRQFELKAERFLLTEKQEAGGPQSSVFPSSPRPPDSLLRADGLGDRMVVLNRAPHEGLQNDMVLYGETKDTEGQGFNPWFKLGARNSALGNLRWTRTPFPWGVVPRTTEQRCAAVCSQQPGHQTAEPAGPGHGVFFGRIESSLGRGPSAAGEWGQVAGLDRSPANGAP